MNWGRFTQNASGGFINSYGGMYTGNDVVQVSPPWTPNPALTAYSYWQTFTDAQHSSLRALINSLSVQYGITRVAYSPSPILYEPNANALANFIGLLGHSVISNQKWDPGPVLNWNSVLGN